MKNFVDKFQ